MKKYAAESEARRRWSTPGFDPTARYGTVMRARTSPIYRVGYQQRDGSAMVVCGSSDESWEAAFASVKEPTCPCDGDYCTDPNCGHPEHV